MTLQTNESRADVGAPEGSFYRGVLLASLMTVPAWLLLLGVARLLL